MPQTILASRRRRVLAAALGSSVALLWGCGGSDPSVGSQDITFAFVFEAHAPAAQGGQSSAAVEVIDEDRVESTDEAAAFNAAVALRVVGPMPPGVSADFDRASITPGQRASMVVRGDADAQPGRHQLLVAGQISGASTTRFSPHTISVTGNCAAGTEAIRQVFASRTGRTIGLTGSGAVFVWGHNAEPFAEGPLASPTDPAVPSTLAFYAAQRVSELAPARSAASVGGTSSFVLSDGGALRVLTRYFRAGVGAPHARAGWFVHEVPELAGFVQVVADDSTYYALRDDGTVWRFNAFATSPDGQLQFAPLQRMSGFADVTLLAAGAHHLLALRRDGSVLARGVNDHGQIGNGTAETVFDAIPIPGLTDIIHLAAGDEHSLALRANGTALAWGRGDQGQLGDGFTNDALRPVEVVTVNNNPISAIIGVAAGSNHTLAHRADGTMLAWGRGAEGQLGTGSIAPARNPVQVDNGLAARIGAGGNASFRVVFGSGAVQGWGDNSDGQLGDGTARSRPRPGTALGLGQGEGRHCVDADAGPVTVFSDAEFADAQWQAIIVAVPVDGPAQVAAQRPTGGNPLAYRGMVHQLLTPAGQALQLQVVHLKLDAIYRPAESGSIFGIDYGEDRILLPGQAETQRRPSGNGAFRQGDRLYASNVQSDIGDAFAVGQWVTANWANLGPEQFSMIGGPACASGERCPDFTPSGAPITFGYMRQSGAGAADPRYTVEHGIDNWRVLVRR